MDIKEACDVFGIYSVNKESKGKIKKRYRELMKEYHPDNCKGDSIAASKISEAYSIMKKLCNAKDNLEKTCNNDINIISMEEIIEIFNNNDIQRMKSVRKGTYIALATKYKVDNRWITNISIVEYNIYGRYNIRMDIDIPDLDEYEVQMNVYGKIICTNISTSVKIINISIADGLSIEYWINSKRISHD